MVMNADLICVSCRVCGRRFLISVTEAEYASWQSGTCIQNAMPNLSVEERELLISKTCGTCWDKMFDGLDTDDS